jgi:hypothetical protein
MSFSFLSLKATHKSIAINHTIKGWIRQNCYIITSSWKDDCETFDCLMFAKGITGLKEKTSAEVEKLTEDGSFTPKYFLSKKKALAFCETNARSKFHHMEFLGDVQSPNPEEDGMWISDPIVKAKTAKKESSPVRKADHLKLVVSDYVESSEEDEALLTKAEEAEEVVKVVKVVEVPKVEVNTHTSVSDEILLVNQKMKLTDELGKKRATRMKNITKMKKDYPEASLQEMLLLLGE